MKKVEIEKIPDKLLHIKNAYPIAAITWIIEMVENHKRVLLAN